MIGNCTAKLVDYVPERENESESHLCINQTWKRSFKFEDDIQLSLKQAVQIFLAPLTGFTTPLYLINTLNTSW
jgi:hypothetical protein